MINFFAPINNLGYGIHSYNFMRALDTIGETLSLFTPNGSAPQTVDRYIDKWLANKINFSKNDPSVMIFHEWFMNRFTGTPTFGFPVFELALPKESLNILKSVDYILQPSEWGKKYLESEGFTNVHVVPEGYNPDKFNINEFNFERKKKEIQEHGIVFSHVGKFESRKCSLDILSTFTYALEDYSKNCTLIVHMINPFFPEWLNMIQKHLVSLRYAAFENTDASIGFIRGNLRVVVVKTALSDIRDVYNVSHFGLYASKAEGWNLPLIESIASGLPCVTTDWAGQSEFLQSYPKELIIAQGEEEIADDGIWFRGDRGKWITPDLSSLKTILRSISENPIKYLEMYKDCHNVVKKYTWQNAAETFISLKNQLC